MGKRNGKARLRPLFAVFRAMVCAAFLAMVGIPAHAESADCSRPDPTNFDQVFACMSSLHSGQNGQGNNPFVTAGITNCSSAAHFYASALRSSHIPSQEIPDLIPSCDLLAKGMEQLKGSPQAWSACTDYPGHFDPAHMKACLDRFLPGYYGGRRSLQSLSGCADATQQYELALRSATKAHDRVMSSMLPEGYQKPDCTVVAGMIGKGSACLNYAQSADHVQQCLGAEAVRYTDCGVLRQVYETKLRQAYGGVLPPNYAALTCDQLGGLIEQAKAAQAQLRAQQAERQRQMAAEMQRRRDAARNFGSLDSGFGGSRYGYGSGIVGWVLGFLGTSFIWGLVVHGAVVTASLLYASRKARSGEWMHVAGLLAGVFTRVFALTMMGVHAAIAAAGVTLTAWPWLVGAAVAIILGKVVSVLMWMFGMFRNPPVVVGKVDQRGKAADPVEPAAPPKEDKGRATDW